MSIIAASVSTLLLALPLPPLPVISVAIPVASSPWVTESGDTLLIDTKENVGYLMHADGRSIDFPVVTGQRRHVYYIGRSYNATTPNWAWRVGDMEIKGDRVTFGADGRFLRMFKDDKEYTAYGIHEHRDGVEMLERTSMERFRSMGCIIVHRDIMDILVKTYERNGGIDILTQHGIDDVRAAYATLQGRGENM